jgi:hypothetical protein
VVRERGQQDPGEKLRGDRQFPGRDGFELRSAAECDGQFIKSVQRIPVEINLDGPAEWARAVSPGVSAEATVTHCIAWLAGGRFSKVN